MYMIFIEYEKDTGYITYQHNYPTEEMIASRPDNSIITDSLPEYPSDLLKGQSAILYVNVANQTLYYEISEIIEPPKELTIEEKTDQLLLNTECLAITQELNLGGI